jgi:hypothetical protein
MMLKAYINLLKFKIFEKLLRAWIQGRINFFPASEPEIHLYDATPQDQILLRQHRHDSLKGIVSRDFEVCFLVPLDSSDIDTLPERVRFF